jgi:hypothetical protein
MSGGRFAPLASADAAPFGRKPYGAAGRRRATVPASRRPVVARLYAVFGTALAGQCGQSGICGRIALGRRKRSVRLLPSNRRPIVWGAGEAAPPLPLILQKSLAAARNGQILGTWTPHRNRGLGQVTTSRRGAGS